MGHIQHRLGCGEMGPLGEEILGLSSLELGTTCQQISKGEASMPFDSTIAKSQLTEVASHMHTDARLS